MNGETAATAAGQMSLDALNGHALIYRDIEPELCDADGIDGVSPTQPSLLLLNALAAPKGTDLERIVNVLTRIENLSHILVWSRSAEGKPAVD